MRTVIFDLDGTLADTSRDLINAANACFRALGLGDVLDHATDAPTALRGGRAMLTLGFARTGSHGADEIDRQYPRLLEAYRDDIDSYTVLYPGAMNAVHLLKSAGYAVGICTNKPAGLAETLMTRLGVRGDFAALVGADTLPVRKPDPAPYLAAVRQAGGDPGRSLLVGDTETDFKTARAAGVPVILVTFGPLGPAVAEMQPDGLIGHYDDLGGEVQRLIG
jgi:phosphoglycolate phosphatase